MVKRFFVFFIGVLTAIILLELGLRLFGFIYQINMNIPVKLRDKAYVILCLGNSYTKGCGVPPKMSYPAQLQEMFDHRSNNTKVQVINEGVANQNTTELLRKLRVMIKKHHPSLIILQTGQTNSWNYLGYVDFFIKQRKGVSFYNMFEYYFIEFLQRSSVYKFFNLFYFNKLRDNYNYLYPPERAEKLFKFVKFREKVELQEKEGIVGPDLMDRGYVDEALDLFMDIIRTYPKQPYPYYEIGFLYRMQRNYEEALRWYLKALDVALASHSRSMIINSSLRIRDILLNHNSPYNRVVTNNMKRMISDHVQSHPRQVFHLWGLSELELSHWVEADINEMVRIINQEKVALIIQNYPIEWFVNSTLSRISGTLNVPFVDNYSVFQNKIAEGVLRSDLFVPDNHCSAEGYRLMAENIFNQIEAEGFMK